MLDDGIEIVEELMLGEAEDLPTEVTESAIASGITTGAVFVVGPIDLDDEADLGGSARRAESLRAGFVTRAMKDVCGARSGLREARNVRGSELGARLRRRGDRWLGVRHRDRGAHDASENARRQRGDAGLRAFTLTTEDGTAAFSSTPASFRFGISGGRSGRWPQWVLCWRQALFW